MNEKSLTALDILKGLPRSNCQECGEITCLAFAAMVIKNEKQANDCPYLDKNVAARIALESTTKMPTGPTPEGALNKVRERIKELDFKEASRRLNIPLVKGRLRVHLLGRIFDIDQNGALHTMAHINNWLHGPLLHYILDGQDQELTGQWVPYGDFKGVEEAAPFFEHRCVKTFHKMADEQGDLFFSILETFGKKVDKGLVDADISVRLMLLPKLPLLFSYWIADEELPSRLAVHFDKTASTNLDVESIFFLVAGLCEMFTRFIHTHGSKGRGAPVNRSIYKLL